MAAENAAECCANQATDRAAEDKTAASRQLIKPEAA